MPVKNSDRDWERFARLDPYYAVTTQETYHKENLSDRTLGEFFESGERHIEEIFRLLHTHFVPDFHPRRALDFGCGVGRLVIPLAARCSSVVGVDVSETMLSEAQENCARRGISNVEFVLGDDALTRVQGSFDFVNSHVVFQHIPVPRGERLVKELIDRMRENGVGVLHFAYSTEKSWLRRSIPWARRSIPGVHNVLNLVQGRAFDYPLMQAHRYHLNTIFRLLQAHGCDHSYLRFTSYPGYSGVIILFQRTTLASL
jgi:2-polyprenyl-3-methyl-5-hydroxy-6-metoxy-1,4-benzoquinol methylase